MSRHSDGGKNGREAICLDVGAQGHLSIPSRPDFKTDWDLYQDALCNRKRGRGLIDVIAGISIYRLVPTLR